MSSLHFEICCSILQRHYSVIGTSVVGKKAVKLR